MFMELFLFCSIVINVITLSNQASFVLWESGSLSSHQKSSKFLHTKNGKFLHTKMVGFTHKNGKFLHTKMLSFYTQNTQFFDSF